MRLSYSHHRLWVGFTALLLLSIGTMVWAAEPISAGSITAVDLPDAKAKIVTIELDTARFDRQSVGHLTLKANNLDLREGTLDNLNLSIKNGQFGDRLQLTYFNVITGGFAFDSFELLNHQRFILNAPVEGTVSVRLTEANLNEYLAHPKTLEKINKAIAKQTGGIQLVRLTEPHFGILPQQKLQLDINAVIGESVVLPLRLIGHIALVSGDLQLENLSVVSEATQLPLEVAGLLQEQLNKIISVKRFNSNDFQMSASHLETHSHELNLSGNARIAALKLGDGK